MCRGFGLWFVGVFFGMVCFGEAYSAEPEAGRFNGVVLAGSGADLGAINSIVTQVVGDHTLHAMVIGLIDRSGSSIYALGSGSLKGISPDTEFGIASLTKTFTALLVMELVEKGEIDLNASISRYLPRFPSRLKYGVDAHRRSLFAPITVGQLLTHSSGLPAMPRAIGTCSTLSQSWSCDPYIGVNEADLVLELWQRSFQLLHEPGKVYSYSNMGFMILTDLLQNHYGQSYASILQSRILGPLKMSHTGIGVKHLNGSLGVPDSELIEAFNFNGRPATLWHFWNGNEAQSPTDQLGAGVGGLRSTADDLLKYLQEELGVTHLLEMDAALQGTHQVIRIGNVSTAKDWASNSEGVRLWHNGLIPGFTSTLCLDRQPSTAPLGGAFVINNQNDEARDNAFTDLTCGLTLNLVNQR